MLRTIATASLLVLATSAQGNETDVKVVKGFVVAVEATRLTLSNVPLAAVEVPKEAAPKFALPKPKPGEAGPSWVTAEPAKTPAAGEPAPRMRMMVTSPADKGAGQLQLTELDAGSVKLVAADYPAGSAVTVTYREVDGRKRLEKVERDAVEPKPGR